MTSRLIALLILTGCSSGSKSPAPPPTPPPPINCTHTLTWTNPTHREENTDGDSLPLDSDELITATLYAFRIPMAAPEEVASTHSLEPYLLTWERPNMPGGAYYYRLTVSNETGESDQSNEITKECR